MAWEIIYSALDSTHGSEFWITDGTAAPIGNPGPTWATAIGGVGYNGDGSSDRLIENTTGTLVGYTLNSGGVVTAAKTITSFDAAIGLSAISAIVIQGVTPDQLSSADFVFR